MTMVKSLAPALLISRGHLGLPDAVGVPLLSLFPLVFGIWHELGQILKFCLSPQTHLGPNPSLTQSIPSPISHAPFRNDVQPQVGQMNPQVSRECANAPHCCATHSTTRGSYKTCGHPSNQQATVVQTTQEETWWWQSPWWQQQQQQQQQQQLQWGQQWQWWWQPAWGPLWRSHFEGMFQLSYSIVYWLVEAVPSSHKLEDHELSLGPNCDDIAIFPFIFFIFPFCSVPLFPLHSAPSPTHNPLIFQYFVDCHCASCFSAPLCWQTWPHSIHETYPMYDAYWRYWNAFPLARIPW